MTFIRKIGAPALALAFGLGTVMSVAPAFASKDRVEHQDKQDKQDHSRDKGGERGDKGDHNNGR